MNITKENIDALNAVIKVAIVADDYRAKVDQMLSDYRKKADIPGFRKGHVGFISSLFSKKNRWLENRILQFIKDYG